KEKQFPCITLHVWILKRHSETKGVFVDAAVGYEAVPHPCWIFERTSSSANCSVVAEVREELGAPDERRSQGRHTSVVFPILLLPDIKPWTHRIRYSPSEKG